MGLFMVTPPPPPTWVPAGGAWVGARSLPAWIIIIIIIFSILGGGGYFLLMGGSFLNVADIFLLMGFLSLCGGSFFLFLGRFWGLPILPHYKLFCGRPCFRVTQGHPPPPIRFRKAKNNFLIRFLCLFWNIVYFWRFEEQNSLGTHNLNISRATKMSAWGRPCCTWCVLLVQWLTCLTRTIVVTQRCRVQSNGQTSLAARTFLEQESLIT